MKDGSGKWPGWMVNSSQVSSGGGAALGGDAVSVAGCMADADADADADPKALLLLLLVCNDGGPPSNGLLLPNGLLVLTCTPPKLASRLCAKGDFGKPTSASTLLLLVFGLDGKDGLTGGDDTLFPRPPSLVAVLGILLPPNDCWRLLLRWLLEWIWTAVNTCRRG